LSGRGLCDELITRPEEFYRLWCVVVCDLEKKPVNEEAKAHEVVIAPKEKKKGTPQIRCPLRFPFFWDMALRHKVIKVRRFETA